MKRDFGIARCGLACCLCSENSTCGGCDSSSCRDNGWCENLKCSKERGLSHCYECGEILCSKGMLAKIRPLAFTQFARRYGEKELLDCLERNERTGVVYHRDGLCGDYDAFSDIEEIIEFIKTGKSARDFDDERT